VLLSGKKVIFTLFIQLTWNWYTGLVFCVLLCDCVKKIIFSVIFCLIHFTMSARHYFAFNTQKICLQYTVNNVSSRPFLVFNKLWICIQDTKNISSRPYFIFNTLRLCLQYTKNTLCLQYAYLPSIHHEHVFKTLLCLQGPTLSSIRICFSLQDFQNVKNVFKLLDIKKVFKTLFATHLEDDVLKTNVKNVLKSSPRHEKNGLQNPFINVRLQDRLCFDHLMSWIHFHFVGMYFII
jgi:hypothetical protein